MKSNRLAMSHNEEKTMKKPSPQTVGREFVKQYFTLLHHSPQFLHRLYGRNSTFYHGGPGKVAEVVCGRAKIQETIMLLQLNDCYARIHHVDAQATLSDGIVVQVLGELSSNGQPMKKFTQTVVLASTATNQFYIHNDILRYKDEALEEEEEAEFDEELEDEVVEPEGRATSPESLRSTSQEPLQEEPDSEPVVKDPMPEVVDAVPEVEDVVHAVQDVTPEVEDVTPEVEDAVPEVEDVAPEVEDVVPVVQDITPEVEDVTPEVEDIAPEVEDVTPEVEDVTPEVEDVAPEEEDVAPEVEDVAPEVEDVVPVMQDVMPTDEHVRPKVEEAKPPVQKKRVKAMDTSPAPVDSPPKPLLWSAVVSRNVAPITVAPSGMPPRAIKTSGKQTRVEAPAEKQNAPAQKSRYGNRADEREGKPEMGNRRFVRHPDSHQMFIGNLPLDATEEELKKFFSAHGNVVDLWINTSVAGKVSNFGFVTYDGAETVQRILKSKPIIFRNMVRLTVGEKRPKAVPEGESRYGGERRDVRGKDNSVRPNRMIRNQATNSSKSHGEGRPKGHRQ